MKILCVAATKIELEPLIRLLGNSRRYISAGDFRYRRDALEVDLLVTGIGIIPTIYHTPSQMRSGPYDLVLNVGIAGSFRSDWEPGMVVRVVEEAFGDMGVQKETGYQTMFEAGFWKAHAAPFKQGKLVPLVDKRWLGGLDHLPEARGLTVNMVSESRDHAQLKYERFKADVETMEGAALFYLAMMEQVPVLQIRAVSNRVGDRDPDHWNVPLAANRLAAVVLQYLDALEP